MNAATPFSFPSAFPSERPYFRARHSRQAPATLDKKETEERGKKVNKKLEKRRRMAADPPPPFRFRAAHTPFSLATPAAATFCLSGTQLM